MALFGDGKKVAALEAEVASLRQWVEHLNGTDAVQLASLVVRTRAELEAARSELTGVRSEVARAQGELAQVCQGIVETHEEAILQEVGIYAYRHPLDSAMAYRQRLDETRARIKSLVTADRAGRGDAAARTRPPPLKGVEPVWRGARRGPPPVLRPDARPYPLVSRRMLLLSRIASAANSGRSATRRDRGG